MSLYSYLQSSQLPLSFSVPRYSWGWSWKHPAYNHSHVGHGVPPTVFLQPSYLSSLTPCQSWWLHPPSQLIHCDWLDSFVTALRSGRRVGGVWFQTRWYKTMGTSEKNTLALTEGKVALTILSNSHNNFFKIVCHSTTKEKRRSRTLLY